MLIKKKIEDLLNQIKKNAAKNNTIKGFLIGNTAKIVKSGSYITPVRNLGQMTAGGAIVYSEQQAIKISKLIDGKVDYILVDAEKKISDNNSIDGETANIERVVRENTKKSKLLVYKGNDLSVDAVDSLLSFYFKDNVTGLGGKSITIIGAGNLGSKIALKLVERGANVTITRRNNKKLQIISKAINYIKPKYTKAKIKYTSNNMLASKNADILIGATNGIEIISSDIVNKLSPNSLIVEAGKGTLSFEAIQTAKNKNIKIFRLDITAALTGLISLQLSLDEKINHKMGSKVFYGETIISGGVLGSQNDIVVDNFNNPLNIFGIADGKGDFIKDLDDKNLKRIKGLQKIINRKQF